MATVNSYLNFNGNTEDAFNFYKSVFGGEFSALQRFGDTAHGASLPAGDQGKIMHVCLPVSKETMLMGTDALESMGQAVTIGTNYSISIAPDDMDEANRIFDGLAVGGKVEMPLQKMFWGAYFGLLRDKFGIQWMINFVNAE